MCSTLSSLAVPVYFICVNNPLYLQPKVYLTFTAFCFKFFPFLLLLLPNVVCMRCVVLSGEDAACVLQIKRALAQQQRFCRY